MLFDEVIKSRNNTLAFGGYLAWQPRALQNLYAFKQNVMALLNWLWNTKWLMGLSSTASVYPELILSGVTCKLFSCWYSLSFVSVDLSEVENKYTSFNLAPNRKNWLSW